MGRVPSRSAQPGSRASPCRPRGRPRAARPAASHRWRRGSAQRPRRRPASPRRDPHRDRSTLGEQGLRRAESYSRDAGRPGAEARREADPGSAAASASCSSTPSSAQDRSGRAAPPDRAAPSAGHGRATEPGPAAPRAACRPRTCSWPRSRRGAKSSTATRGGLDVDEVDLTGLQALQQPLQRR